MQRYSTSRTVDCLLDARFFVRQSCCLCDCPVLGSIHDIVAAVHFHVGLPPCVREYQERILLEAKVCTLGHPADLEHTKGLSYYYLLASKLGESVWAAVIWRLCGV